MLKRKALMESISSNLHSYLKKIGNNLSVPDKKFLRDSLVGLPLAKALPPTRNATTNPSNTGLMLEPSKNFILHHCFRS
ncbi:MAG: hypothetical protein ACYTBX_09060 [Planctomycetota bacterium]|jgi:hypothetical protein